MFPIARQAPYNEINHDIHICNMCIEIHSNSLKKNGRVVRRYLYQCVLALRINNNNDITERINEVNYHNDGKNEIMEKRKRRNKITQILERK